MKSTTEAAHAANTLTSWISGVSTAIEDLSRDVAALLEHNRSKRSRIKKAAATGLGQLSRDFLTANQFAVGAGTFLAAESVEEGMRPLEWWFRRESGSIDRLDFDLTPGSSRYYDYEKLPFFSTAASTGKPTVWGPYIDYLGFEEYILTFAAPFSVAGDFTGVAGCDIRLRDLEPLIMPDLRQIPGDAALINASNRVILGNSGRYLVGERITSDASSHQTLPLDVANLGLSLIYPVEPPQSRNKRN